MAMILMILSLVVALGSLVCWIMTLIKMFGDEENGGVGKGIFGIICALYALIWGWQNHEKHDFKKVMMAWTGLIIGSVLINILSGVVA